MKEKVDNDLNKTKKTSVPLTKNKNLRNFKPCGENIMLPPLVRRELKDILQTTKIPNIKLTTLKHITGCITNITQHTWPCPIYSTGTWCIFIVGLLLLCWTFRRPYYLQCWPPRFHTICIDFAWQRQDSNPGHWDLKSTPATRCYLLNIHLISSWSVLKLYLKHTRFILEHTRFIFSDNVECGNMCHSNSVVNQHAFWQNSSAFWQNSSTNYYYCYLLFIQTRLNYFLVIPNISPEVP